MTFVINKWRFQPVGGTRGDSGFGVGNKAHSSKRCDFSSVPDRIRCDEQKSGEIVTNPKKGGPLSQCEAHPPILASVTTASPHQHSDSVRN